MFVAVLTSFLACASACLAEFLSKPIETRVATDSSDGSAVEGTEVKFRWWLAKDGILPTTFLVGVTRELPIESPDSREKNEEIGAGNFALRMWKTLSRYREPARMPQIPGKMDLLQDENKSCRPARYTKDLSEKLMPSSRNLVETGMSKKKGTNDANITA